MSGNLKSRDASASKNRLVYKMLVIQYGGLILKIGAVVLIPTLPLFWPLDTFIEEELTPDSREISTILRNLIILSVCIFYKFLTFWSILK